MSDLQMSPLARPLTLPCGVTLKNRIAESAMSDSLGYGAGNPTDDEIRLYDRWARGGLALSIIGEVQSTPHFAEKPGNLISSTGSVSCRKTPGKRTPGGIGFMLRAPRLIARVSGARALSSKMTLPI